MQEGFHDQLISVIPHLRNHAFVLTKNKSSSDDLVHDAITNALANHESFVQGTNFAAWIHCILRNKFVSDLRRKREVGNIDDVPEASLSLNETQDDTLAIGELSDALNQLPHDQREAMMMIFVNDMSYEEAAAIKKCSLGTIKSRVFRARQALHARLLGGSDTTLDAKQRVRRSRQARERIALA